MKWFTSLLLFVAFIGFANSTVAQDCPNCLQAPTEVFSQNLLVVKRPVRNAVANARYGISNRVGNGCTGRSVRTVMAVPVTVKSYGSTGSMSRRSFASNGGSGFGYFGAQRKWWAGKNVGWQSPGTRRASRNACFAVRSGVPFNTTGPTANSMMPVVEEVVVPVAADDVSFMLDTEFIKIKMQEAPEYAYNARWTWPGNNEASLRNHMASGPHWHNDSHTASYSELKERHDGCHDRIGPYSPAMIRRSNSVRSV